MLNKFLKRIKCQKGMSGVLVALLLVMVGVGLVAGISKFMDDNKNNIMLEAQGSIDNALGK